jgi:hypothetical protein
MDLKDGPYPRILVHEIQRRTVHGPNQGWRMVDGLATRISGIEYASEDAIMMCWVTTDVPCETSVCDLDVLTSWLKA